MTGSKDSCRVAFSSFDDSRVETGSWIVHGIRFGFGFSRGFRGGLRGSEALFERTQSSSFAGVKNTWEFWAGGCETFIKDGDAVADVTQHYEGVVEERGPRGSSRTQSRFSL